MSRRKSIIIFLLVILATVLAAFFIAPKNLGAKYLPWRLGLDLVGGTALVYEVDLSGIEESKYDEMVSSLRAVIESRVNQFGVAEPKVAVARKGSKYELLIELAGVKAEDAAAQIGATPTIDFREIKDLGNGKVQVIKTALTGRYIESATLGFSNTNQPVFNFQLKDEGPKIFEEITARNVGKPLCIFVDDDFIFPATETDPSGPTKSCPMVNEKISGGSAQISGGDITIESAKQLVDRFQAGALAVPITLINQRDVNASAAADSLTKIIIAGIVGTLLVMFFMVLNYGAQGLIANLALLIYIILTLSIFKLIPGFTMSLSGIAGFILSIGMAVDANILIFERTKEELKRGLARESAVEEGFRRAWSSIRDSNISTILTAVILYYFTSSFVKGFALTLGLGVLVSMFSAIYVTRVLMRIVTRNKKA